MTTNDERDESLAASVARAVAERGAELKPEDDAAVDLALRYANAIDAAISRGGQDMTKGLYLGPHLLATLRELGCTPAGRVALVGKRDEAAGGKSKLAAIRAGRGA